MSSLRSRIIRVGLRYWVDHSFDTTAPIDQQRAVLERVARRMPMPRRVKVEPVTIGQLYAEWLRPANAQPGHVILYFHGGAYTMGSCSASRVLAALVAKAATANVLTINYRLAPEHPFPAALEDAQAAYHWLLEQGIQAPQIAVIGESAGGGLALATGLALRDAGTPLPGAIVCMSPWTDLAMTGETIQTRAAVDPWIKFDDFGNTAPLYIGDNDPCHPYISPLYGDLHDLPPLLIHVGDHELMLSDSTRLADRAQTAGVETTLKVWDGMWHVFQSNGVFMPESRRSIREIGAFIQARMS